MELTTDLRWACRRTACACLIDMGVPNATATVGRTIVAVVVCRGGWIGLLQRSERVGHDVGLWHCVTGYLGPMTDPLDQALQELGEETGLVLDDLDSIAAGPVLELRDAGDAVWTVHTFRAETRRRTFKLNWEHRAYAWCRPDEVGSAEHVAWLAEVVEALGLQDSGSS